MSSTKWGVTGGSKSDVGQVRLEDFMVLAATGGVGQTYLGGKKKKFLHNYIVGFVKRVPLCQVSFERKGNSLWSMNAKPYQV